MNSTEHIEHSNSNNNNKTPLDSMRTYFLILTQNNDHEMQRNYIYKLHRHFTPNSSVDELV